MSADNNRLVRVGLFVALTLAVLIAVLGVLGRSRSLFSEKAVLHTSFDNISGLVVGAPVRLAGIDIGIVQSIRFDRDLSVKKVRVALGIQSRYLERIRTDSIARLSSKGLLGDMLINISVGSANYQPLKSGDTLNSQETEALTQIVDSVQGGISEVRKLVTGVDERVRLVLSDQVAHDISRVVHASANVMEKIEKGDGLLHGVIYDPRFAQSGAALLSQASQSAEHLNHALQRVDTMIATIENKEGTLHGLIYRDDVGKLVAELQHTASDLSALAKEVRHGQGTMHSVIYGDGKTNLVADLGAAARILRALAEEMQAGRGTVGGLLRDPTIYQDLKGILGNVKRNTLLKSIIRANIRSEGLSRESGAASDSK